LQAEAPVQIGIDLRELGAQHDLQQQRNFQRRQTSADLEVGDGLAGPETEQACQKFLAVAAIRAESK
jgi:hypothetical protein